MKRKGISFNCLQLLLVGCLRETGERNNQFIVTTFEKPAALICMTEEEHAPSAYYSSVVMVTHSNAWLPLLRFQEYKNKIQAQKNLIYNIREKMNTCEFDKYHLKKNKELVEYRL